MSAVATELSAADRQVAGPVVIYHANCPDGFAAALAAWLHFEGRGDYLPMAHADALPDLSGRETYMLDIAFDRGRMEAASAAAARLTVLDHHQSSADALTGFQCRCSSVHFDMDKSAARMAWEYFHPGIPIPALVAHVEDRDLLRWALSETPGYLASLDFGPHNFYRWAGVMRMPDEAYARFMARGQAMHDQFEALARAMAAEATPFVLDGVHGLIANAPNVFHTAVGALLVARCETFAALWCLEGGGTRVKVGLRAAGFNTIPLAEAFGGGGHPYASAFRLPIERLGELVAGALAVESTESLRVQN